MTIFFVKLKSVWRSFVARTIGSNLSALTLGKSDSDMRVLFVANALIPTLQLSFVKPLTELIDAGAVAIELISEQQLKERFGKRLQTPKASAWIGKRFRRFRPTVVIFCRYSGPHTAYIVELARTLATPTLFHIDDDLLNVPPEIGHQKYLYHNHEARLAAVRYLLKNSDLVYCSTEHLKQRLCVHGEAERFVAGDIYCSGTLLAAAQHRPVRKIGYMGFDHAHDLELVLPALIEILDEFPALTFDLFGSIPKPKALDKLGKRVRVIPPIGNYEQFMHKFATLDWDIGICPLAKTDFNSVKANTKWVEYTSVGAAVVASRGTIYDECCADDCGVLVDGHLEWKNALSKLITGEVDRFALVSRAQARVNDRYSGKVLTQQILNIISRADKLRSAPDAINPVHHSIPSNESYESKINV